TGGFASVLVVFSLIGLFTNGYASRASAAAVQFDQARTPHIPYVQCAGHQLQQLCFLGDETSAADTLLWGDSHMLAWGPAFQSIFTQRHGKAVFAPLHGCPPFLGVAHRKYPGCAPGNQAIQSYIHNHPEVKTVVLAASWRNCSRDDSELIKIAEPSSRRGVETTRHALS